MMCDVLSKIHRVPKPLFELAFKNGIWYRGSTLDIKVYTRHSEEPSIAFTVPTSVSKKATVRNTIKRRGRSAVSQLISRIKKDVVILVFFKNNSIQLSVEGIKQELIKITQKAKILL